MKIPFSPPYIDDTVISEVVDSLRSGWITSGPKVKALEEEIKLFSNAKEVLCVNSWTSGAIMMLRWLGVHSGDEVIVPAYTYSATALAVLHAGAKPVMVDSGKDFNISVEAIRNAITSKTKAIIPVDIAGFPCDYERIMELVNEPDIRGMFQPTSSVQERLGRILVMNDAAHSLGAYYSRNQRTGCETDIAIFSLHAVKNVTTAEGGAICLNLPAPFDNAELYKELHMMSLNCQTKDAFSKSKAGGWRYDIVGLGMKINMADVNAAIGLAQIREYPALLKERRRVFNTYSKAFADYDWAIIPPSVDGEKESSYHNLLIGILSGNEDWLVKSNVEAGEGFADIIVETDDPDEGIIAELKYTKDFKAMEKSCEKALKQIKDRRYQEYLLNDDRQNIMYYGIAFCRKRCKVLVER